MEIIKVKNLTKYYGQLKAVDNISFTVEKGSLFAFLGVNGAGKSTTINILSGALNPSAGEVTICGKVLEKEPEEVKKRIGIVFQDSVLDARLTVSENLRSRAAFYGITGKNAKITIEKIAEEFRLTDLL